MVALNPPRKLYRRLCRTSLIRPLSNGYFVVFTAISSDNGLFELSSLPRDASGQTKDSSAEGKRGSGSSAIFVARNRFAILNKATQVSLVSSHGYVCPRS